MSASTIQKLAFICGLALVGLTFYALIHRSGHAQANHSLGLKGAPAPPLAAPPTAVNPSSSGSLSVPPFIVSDTATDSPGTNLETRIVTFTAEVGGTPPILRQWKVDKGSGFVAVSPGATNSVLILSNARVADTGRYALFATNRLAATNTTPVPLVVVEGVD